MLRPPEDGLPHLRHDRAGELRAEPGELTLQDGRIAAFEHDPAAELQVDASGCALVPGFVDCHTHLPFAGWRGSEYEQKVTGVPYEEIARAGGGIASSARALREASDDQVLDQAEGLAAEMLAHGTTTFEGKCGYGLSRDAELRSLELARTLGERVRQTIQVTALLAHAVPPDHTKESWWAEVERMVPEVAARELATALDIFVESIAFSNHDLGRMGELAHEHGLTLRAHVEQLSTMRSVPVALAAGARTLDHLSRLHPDDLAPLARAECAAVLLPGAEFLGAEELAPGRALVDAGAIVVLATDLNPGTSPVLSLPVIAGLGVRRYGLSAREAMLALTLNAAWALGLSQEVGSLEVGKRADLVLLDGPIEHLAYRFGHNPVLATFVAGEPAWIRPDAAWRLAR